MVPDINIIFKLNGVLKTLCFRKLPLSVWSELKRVLTFTPKTLILGLEDADVDAATAVVWLERRQTERKLAYHESRRDLEELDGEFEVMDFIIEGRSANGEDPAEADDPDPTVAG